MQDRVDRYARLTMHAVSGLAAVVEALLDASGQDPDPGVVEAAVRRCDLRRAWAAISCGELDLPLLEPGKTATGLSSGDFEMAEADITFQGASAVAFLCDTGPVELPEFPASGDGAEVAGWVAGGIAESGLIAFREAIAAGVPIDDALA